MIPAVVPCTRELFQLRREGHQLFDALWTSGIISRGDAYHMLARHLGLTRETCRWRMFTEAQCRSAIEFCRQVVNLPRSRVRVKRHFRGKERAAKRRAIRDMREREAMDP